MSLTGADLNKSTKLFVTLLLGVIVLLFSCEPDRGIDEIIDIDTEIVNLRDSVLSNDSNFINSVLLKGEYRLSAEIYELENCPSLLRNKTSFKADFEGVMKIGDINADNEVEYVWVLPPLSQCEDGDSYYFSDTLLGRIYTDSNCCHPNSIHNMGDIDEDGICELGQYYSSCTSRYKSIRILSFKKGGWKPIDEVTFMINDVYDPVSDFKKLYRKKSRGVVEFLDIRDEDSEGNLITEWKTIKI